jgi:hypothetical protein
MSSRVVLAFWARPRRASEADAKGGCTLGAAANPVSIPHVIEKRGVTTGIDPEPNRQVDGLIPLPPQVTRSARLNLSRWRHGFKSRWEYQVRASSDASAGSPGDTLGDSQPPSRRSILVAASRWSSSTTSWYRRRILESAWPSA